MAKQSDWKSMALKGAGVLAGAGVTGVSAWLLYSRFLVDHKRALPNAIRARRRDAAVGEAGSISRYEDLTATGTPLVLLHSVNAAASAYEVRPLFDQYRDRRPVFAPDLPGFGFSDRDNRVYSPEFYTDTLASWIESEVYRGAPVDIVARPHRGVRSTHRARTPQPGSVAGADLADGFRRGSRRGQRPGGRAGAQDACGTDMEPGVLRRAGHEPSIRHYLKKAFADPIDEGLAQYCYETSHQPGARYAPLYFVAGRLFHSRCSRKLLREPSSSCAVSSATRTTT